MTLLQIKYLIAVGETGNISKAANQLFVSRPTISRAVRELEDEFGVPLFIRTTSGLQLTTEGAFFYEKCLEIQHLSNVLVAQMRILRERMSPASGYTVKIAITPTTSRIIFPQLYREVRNTLPYINLVTFEYSRIQSRSAIEDGIIDFHLTADARYETLPENFERFELMDTQLVFCTSSGNRLAGRKFVTAEDIKDEPLIYLAKYFQDETTLDRLYKQKGFVPNIKFRSLQMSTIREMTAAGLGSAILMQGAIDDGKSIISVPFMPPIPTTICLVWNKSIPHNKTFDDFLIFAHEFKKNLDENKYH